MPTTRNKIVLKGDPRYEEAVVASAFNPGHLVQLDSAGKLKKHATEGGVAERAFAVEDALQGNEIADAAVAENTHPFVLAKPGDEIYAYIKAGEDIAIGDILISAGDGTLIEEGSENSATTVKDRVAVAVEANDLTGSAAVATRSAVRVL